MRENALSLGNLMTLAALAQLVLLLSAGSQLALPALIGPILQLHFGFNLQSMLHRKSLAPRLFVLVSLLLALISFNWPGALLQVYLMANLYHLGA